MQVKEVVKITEKEIDDLHEYKVSWSDADLEKLIEDGIIIKIKQKGESEHLTVRLDGMNGRFPMKN